ncbi:MAG: MoaD/ThiS family protein [Staphylothermus sp.]|nr:MoaD/ThiS family protein [Staphylothermus sp.]
MIIKVKAFSVFTDILGKELVLEISDRENISLSEFIDLLAKKYSGLSKLLETIEYVILVNGERVEEEHLLRDGDEVAILPPASGGL